MPSISDYVAGWRERNRLLELRSTERSLRARSLLPELARLLCRHFGARRVWVFGSLVAGTFGLRSDIDLAVEGLPRTRLFAAGAALERAAPGFQVDLVPIEDAGTLLRTRILTEGEEIVFVAECTGGSRGPPQRSGSQLPEGNR
jgi:predicted nucleotidyltransferase